MDLCDCRNALFGGLFDQSMIKLTSLIKAAVGFTQVPGVQLHLFPQALQTYFNKLPPEFARRADIALQ